MDGRIGNFHCQVQLRAAPEMGQTLASRLDRLIAEQVLPDYSAALDQILGDDPAVYVIRRVHFDADLNLSRDNNENWAAQRWGKRMAGAVIHQIRDGTDLIRFDNQADYVAHFIMDLLKNQAWDHWVYKPFGRYQSQGQVGALRAVLMENPDLIPAILAGLYRLGILDAVLKALGDAGQRELWRTAAAHLSGLEAVETTAIRDAVRPFFEAALFLAGGMEMWARQPPDLENILPGLNGRWRTPDWRDRQSLSMAVMGILQVMGQRGWLRTPRIVNPAHFLGQAMQELDWLDTAWLHHSVLDWLEELKMQRLTSARPGMTLRRGKLLADLLSAIHASGLHLDFNPASSPANLLSLQAVLIAYFPEWGQDPLSGLLVQEILAGGNRLVQARDPSRALESLLQGDLERALSQFPERQMAGLEPDLRRISDLGAPAGAVLQALMSSSPVDLTRKEFDTRCAGTALLLRAILDARLPALLSQVGYPDPADPFEKRLPAVLLELFLSWAGPAGRDENGQIDALLLILAGIEAQKPLEDVSYLQQEASTPGSNSQLVSNSAALRFQAVWQQQLAGFGMTPGEQISHEASGNLVLNLGQDLLNLWARWLRNFSSSSRAYLLENFIDRPGRVMVTAREIRIELQPGALDVVLEMAGYLDPIEGVPWLQGKTVSFH